MIRISYRMLILLALLLLVLPLKWLLCAVLAALIHEGAHIASLILCGGKVESITFDTGGTVIDGFAPDRKAELFSILAGPVSSFILLLADQRIPELCTCGMVQGLFNLMPIYPLDGGRILHLLLSDSASSKVLKIQKIFLRAIVFCCSIILIIYLFKGFG